MALGADAIAVSNSAIQAIGCLGMRACHTNNCPVGIATQKPARPARGRGGGPSRALLRERRAHGAGPGLRSLAREFALDDLTTFDRDIADLTGVAYGGVHL